MKNEEVEQNLSFMITGRSRRSERRHDEGDDGT